MPATIPQVRSDSQQPLMNWADWLLNVGPEYMDAYAEELGDLIKAPNAGWPVSTQQHRRAVAHYNLSLH